VRQLAAAVVGVEPTIESNYSGSKLPHSTRCACGERYGQAAPAMRIDYVNTRLHNSCMSIHYELNGTAFVWDEEKARRNVAAHDGITFEQAAEVFFDPFFRLVDASRNDEARDAVIGYDKKSRLLFVVHIVFEDQFIRIISARKATPKERKDHDS
jgi:uncharacterized protein